jgi:hypothetical protein
VEESEVSPLNIIPLWFSILVCQLGDEQYARLWLQFRDVISPYRHDHDDDYHHHYAFNINVK